MSRVTAVGAMKGGSRRLPATLFFVSAGIGTITKGPVALAAPLLVAIAWALIRRRPGMLKSLGWLQGLLLYAAIVVPWLVMVESRNPGYLRYAIIGENLERMTSNRFETSRPFYFYAKVILPCLFPWILYAGAVAVRRGRSWRQTLAGLASESDRGRLATAYSGTWLG